MSNWLRSIFADAGAIGEVFVYLWKNRRWWLIPVVALLVTIGIFLIFATVTGVGPFIYTLF